MGYILFVILSIVLIVGLAMAVVRNKRPKQGRISGEGTAILREEPSADAPTPARSATATRSEVKTAEKHTPPA